MTTFAELVTLTTAITKRPELSAQTEIAVRTAVLRAHHTDFFPRDLRRAAVPYTVAADAYFYDFENISSMLNNLRALKTIYSTEVTGRQVEQLEYRESDNLFDSSGLALSSVYTLIGDTLRCYFALPTGYMDAYYYANPVVTSAGFSSWIADIYPDDIAGWAAAIVMARTGFLEMAQKYQEDYVKPLKEQLVASHLLATVN